MTQLLTACATVCERVVDALWGCSCAANLSVQTFICRVAPWDTEALQQSRHVAYAALAFTAVTTRLRILHPVYDRHVCFTGEASSGGPGEWSQAGGAESHQGPADCSLPPAGVAALPPPLSLTRASTMSSCLRDAVICQNQGLLPRSSAWRMLGVAGQDSRALQPE